MGTARPIAGVFDSKPYNRDYLTRAIGSKEVAWHFHDFRVEPEAALAAKGAQAARVFVNDVVNREVVDALVGSGVENIRRFVSKESFLERTVP